MNKSGMIVCDTNIWYDIGAGKIDPKKIAILPLVCTYVNLRELSFSPNLYKKPKEIKAAIKAIRKFAKAKLMINPFAYAIQKFSSEYVVQDNSGFKMWELLEKFADNENAISQENQDKIKKYIFGMTNDYNIAIENINKIASPIKMNIKQNGLKKKIRSSDYLPIIQEFFAKVLLQSHQERPLNRNPLGISLNSSSWSELELILEVWSYFFKELEVNPTKKFHGNDWEDIINMTYVGKQARYWTSEKQWIDIIQSNSTTNKYLFQLN